MDRFDMVLDMETDILEVGPTTNTTGLADRPDQKKCVDCAKFNRPCRIPEPRQWGRFKKVKREACVGRRRVCLWGSVIPPRLYALKAKILPGCPAEYASPGPDINPNEDSDGDSDADGDSIEDPDARASPSVDPEEDLDPPSWDDAFLDHFQTATELALANVVEMIKQEKEETYALAWGIQDIRDGNCG